MPKCFISNMWCYLNQILVLKNWRHAWNCRRFCELAIHGKASCSLFFFSILVFLFSFFFFFLIRLSFLFKCIPFCFPFYFLVSLIIRESNLPLWERLTYESKLICSLCFYGFKKNKIGILHRHRTAQKKKRKLYGVNSEIAKNVTESKGPQGKVSLNYNRENIKNVYLNF